MITTATGQQQRIAIGSDVTRLNVDSVMRTAPISSLTDLLETRVPGLVVSHSSGVPGDPSRLRIRGASSILGNNDPILIVDGVRVYAAQSDARNNNLAPSVLGGTNKVAGDTKSYAAPSPIDQIDPNSIETLEVFKGPSASALYGADAANGVIVITTKRGRAGPTQWSTTLGQGVNWLPGSWPDVYHRFGYSVTSANGSSFSGVNPECPWYQIGCVVDSVVQFQALNDFRYSLFAHGQNQLGTATVSGGVSTITYSVTGSTENQTGNLQLPAIEIQRYNKFYGPVPEWMVHPDKLKRWGIDGSVSMQPSTVVSLMVATHYGTENQQRSSLEQGIAQLQGEYIDASQLSNTPLINNEVERATDNNVTSSVSTSVNWRPFSFLPLNASGGISMSQRVDETYIPFGVNSAGPGSSGQTVDTTGNYGVGRGSTRDATLNLGTNILLLNNRISLALGANYHTNTTADFSSSTNQLAPGVTVPTQLGTISCTGSGQDQSCVTLNSSAFNTNGRSSYGYYIAPQLNLSSRFFFTPGFRLDGGSNGTSASYSKGGVNTSSLGNLSATPSLNFSWVALDREGQKPLWGVLSSLRPRVGFGLAATQPLDQGQRLRVLRDTLSNLGAEGILPGVQLTTLGNSQLRPERKSGLEGGMDFTLWENRLTVSVTASKDVTKDDIIQVPVAASVSGNGLGGTSIYKNIGVVKNTGYQLTLSGFVLSNRSVSWNVGGNIAKNTSLVERLNPGQGPLDLGNGTRIVAGYPLFGLWQQPIASFADVNHNGTIDNEEVQLADSVVFVGAPDPNYTLNMSSDLTLFSGLLGLHATMSYQNGATQNNAGALTSQAFLNTANAPGTPLAMEAAIQAARGRCGYSSYNDITFNQISCNGVGSDIGVIQTVNTFRFSDLSINVNVPRRWSRRLGIPRMAVFVQGSNLALHSNYRGKDPNVNAFSTVSAGDERVDLGQIPEPRTWWLKISLNN